MGWLGYYDWLPGELENPWDDAPPEEGGVENGERVGETLPTGEGEPFLER